MKKNVIYILMIILFACFVSADSYLLNNYYLEEGTWNYGIDDSVDIYSPISISMDYYGNLIKPKQIDIDNDGDLELITFHNQIVKIYSINKTLNSWQLEDSISIPDIIVDFDVSTYSNNNSINILTDGTGFYSIIYNGSAYEYGYITSTYPAFEAGVIRCNEWGNYDSICAIHFSSDASGTSCRTDILIINNSDSLNPSFDASYQLNTYTCVIASNSKIFLNAHQNRNINFGDYDRDGKKEITVSWRPAASGALLGDDIYISTLKMVNITTASIDEITNSNCEESDKFTSPIIADFDGGGDLEIIFACQISSDDFKMYVYDSNLNLYGEYPSIGNVEGEILSNLFLLNCFDETPFGDIGILGYDETDNTINLECITGRPNSEGSDREFDPFEIANLSANNSYVYAMDNNFNSLSTLITTFGVFGLELNEGLISDGEIYQLYEAPYNGIMLPNSLRGDGLADMTILTDTNLWFLDDGFTNSNPDIEIVVDPCNPIKLNETVDTLITVTDPDGDDVKITLTSYYGTNDAYTIDWTENYTSGTSINLNWIANTTGLNKQLKITADDTGDSSGNTSLVYTYQVSSTGNERGDCSSSQSTIETEDDDEFIGAAEEFSNDLKSSLIDVPIFGNLFQTSGGLAIFSLIIVLIIFAFGYSQLGKLAGFVFGGFAFIIFTILGFIPLFWVLLVVLIIIIFILIIFFMTGSGTR